MLDFRLSEVVSSLPVGKHIVQVHTREGVNDKMFYGIQFVE